MHTKSRRSNNVNRDIEAELDSAQRAVDLAMIKTNDEWSKIVASGGRSFQISNELDEALKEESKAIKKRDQVRKII